VTESRESDFTHALIAGFVVVSAVNLLGQIIGIELLTQITKPLLMVLLFVWAWHVLPRPRSRAGQYLLVGIVFAWIGDLFLMVAGDLFFLLGIAGFLVMQICYIFAFLTMPGKQHLLKKAPLLIAPFVLYWAGMNVLLQPGVLRIPVLIYSVALVGMSAVALDVAPRCTAPQRTRVVVGAVLFVISDTFIALAAFSSLELGNWQGIIVMGTYVVAQYLIVTSVARTLVAHHSSPMATPEANSLAE